MLNVGRIGCYIQWVHSLNCLVVWISSRSTHLWQAYLLWRFVCIYQQLPWSPWLPITNCIDVASYTKRWKCWKWRWNKMAFFSFLTAEEGLRGWKMKSWVWKAIIVSLQPTSHPPQKRIRQTANSDDDFGDVPIGYLSLELKLHDPMFALCWQDHLSFCQHWKPSCTYNYCHPDWLTNTQYRLTVHCSPFATR